MTAIKKYPYGKIYGKYGDIWAKDVAEKLQKLLDYYECGHCEAELDGLSCEDCIEVFHKKVRVLLEALKP